MAAPLGRSDTLLDMRSLSDLLYREGYRFRFCQAVRLLERLDDKRQPVGRAESPEDEVVRFRAYLSLAFPPSEVAAPKYVPLSEREWVIIPADNSKDPLQRRPAVMTVAFMGLTGPVGSLPRHYTELLIDRVRSHDARHADHTLRDFLDLFNHRLISLFYRSWEKPRVMVHIERRLLAQSRGKPPELDDFSRYLYSLVGLGTPNLLGRQEDLDESLLFYVGLLAQQPRSAEGLRELLSDFFSVPIEVQQFIGAYYPLPEEERTYIGEARCELGRSTVVGDQAYIQDAKFRVVVGPLTIERYCELLPSSEGAGSGVVFRKLVQIVRLFVGPELDFEVQLVLMPGDLSRFGPDDEGPYTPRLGYTAQLFSDEMVDSLTSSIFEGTLTGIAN